MSKLIITKRKDKILTALVSGQKAVQLHLEPQETPFILNNIYIGKVKNIVKNINAAFVEIGNGQIGYYSLTENKNHLFLNPTSTKKLHIGDEIIVQVVKDSIKTKAPVLSCYLNFTGKYCVLTIGKNQIGFSGKISDNHWKNNLKVLLEEQTQQDFGIIIRTNAKNAENCAIFQEISILNSLYQGIRKDAPYRTCYTKLYQAPPAYVASIRDSYAENLEEIITDEEDIFTTMKTYLQSSQPEDLQKLSFYQDLLLPLNKLYSLETALESALSKRVWLKSGGYLVIEPTEALVVIDVNSGKYAGKKNVQDTILKINLEAAQEIGRQLCLRNLSGIIIIDFIDMERSEDKMLLMKTLEQATANDPMKTNVVGISKLNLVEMTRKKRFKPLHEQIN